MGIISLIIIIFLGVIILKGGISLILAIFEWALKNIIWVILVILILSLII
jgi:hypothetical protein